MESDIEPRGPGWPVCETLTVQRSGGAGKAIGMRVVGGWRPLGHGWLSNWGLQRCSAGAVRLPGTKKGRTPCGRIVHRTRRLYR